MPTRRAKPTPRTPAPSEAQVMAQCLEYLRLRVVLAWRTNSGVAVAPATPTSKRRFVRFSGARGCSDILGILPPGAYRLGHRAVGVFLAVECKRPGGRLTPDQNNFLRNVRAAGGVALCVCSVDELARGLEAAGY